MLAEIMKIHLRKRGAGVENFTQDDLNTLTAAMTGYVGAEVEQAIIDARFMALKRSNLTHANPTVDELLAAISRIKPMSQRSAETIAEMVRISDEQGRSVDKEAEQATSTKRTRRVLTS